MIDDKTFVVVDAQDRFYVAHGQWVPVYAAAKKMSMTEAVDIAEEEEALAINNYELIVPRRNDADTNQAT